jgi:tetratricopeptide (TPR) repeat protein
VNVWEQLFTPKGMTAFMVAIVGAAVGLAYVRAVTGTGDESVALEGRRRDLQDEHTAIIEALKALELEQAKLDPAAFIEEKAALVARGAAVLRALDTSDETAAPSEDPLVAEIRKRRDEVGHATYDAALASVVGTPAIAPVWRGALTALLVVAVVGGLSYSARDASVARRGDAPMTGGTAAMGGPVADPRADALNARITADPNDIEALNGLTDLAIAQGDLTGAMDWNKRAYAADPSNLGAIVNKGLLAAAVGMHTRALDLFEEALGVDPNHAGALKFKGIVLMETGDLPGARSALEASLAVAPDTMARRALERVNTLEGGGAAPPPRPAPAAPGSPVATGTITLADGILPDGTETLYVSLRALGGGPPLAAKRLAPGPFPMELSLTTADAIAMGGAPRPFPDRMKLSVRIDRDGNPMTKDFLATFEAEIDRGVSGLAVSLASP